jgi:hypothetical protein
MENFVQMSLETYDSLKSFIEYLKRTLKEERELRSNDCIRDQKKINYLTEKTEQYKKYILEYRCKFLKVEDYSLEHYLDINSWTYGINYKDDLLKMGFTKQEMDEFISNKYEECVKEKKEIKTTGGE